MDSELKPLKKLAHGAAISFVFGMFAYGIVFISKLLAARYFGPSDYGLFILAETMLGIFGILVLVGIHHGPSRYIPIYEHRKEPDNLAGYLDLIFKIPVILSILASIIIFVIAPMLTSFFSFPEAFVEILRLIAIALPFYAINMVFSGIFFAKGKILQQNISRNFIEPLIFLLGVATIFLFNLHIFYLVLFFTLSMVFSFLYSTTVYKRKIRFPKSKVKSYLMSDWISFSWPLLLVGIFNYFIGWTDNLVIGKFLDPTNLGIYAIAYSLSRFLIFFFHIFRTIFMPIISERYAKGDSESISYLFKKSQNWMIGIVLPAALLLAVFGETILTLVYGNAYALGATSIQILIIGFLVIVSVGFCQSILQLHKKTKYIFKANFITAIINLGLNMMLIPLIGITGAAISTAFSLSLQNILFLRKARKLEKLKFDWKVNSKFLLSSIMSIVIIKVVYNVLQLNLYVKLGIVGMLFVGSYISFIFLLKTFDENDLKIMLAIEKRLGLNLSPIKKLIRF